ncbi:hypothetical protein F3Y22_tig00111096pilonHSYRG00159 [Hibiscus syriacus]|uniref:Secreted protein n=1 Tax=Hibiscus syriacus TaxID=106335 RepID=A0A6A2Z191_HIBSY|nr:hypothetical protein F3Y22_tig00111096pilonHSYRG00159 [Hibiscus syriacus]
MKNLHHFLVIAAVIFLVGNRLDDVSGRIINKNDLMLRAVQKAKGVHTPPSGHNGCTHIPGSRGSPCINQGAFTGHVMAPSGLQPVPVVPLRDAY